MSEYCNYLINEVECAYKSAIDIPSTLEEAKKELTIGGEKNSSAHNYAIKNGIRFIEVENDIDKIDEFLKGYHQERKFKFGEENPF